MSVKIPTNKSDVTKEWLQEALDLKSDQVVNINPVEEKNGFLSGVFKAQVIIQGQINHLFIKIISDPDDAYTSIYDTNNFDEVEIIFYKKYLPDLIRFEQTNCKRSELENITPKFYRGDYCLEKEKRGFYLIMEDLSVNCFTMAGKGSARSEGLTFEQVNQILIKMARFHGVSYAFGQQGWLALENLHLKSSISFMYLC